MLLKPVIIKYLTTTIIAPHGVTDLIHAKQTNNLISLINIYGTTNGLFYILSTLDQEIVINTILFITSTIHFQKDIPLRDEKKRYLFTSLLLLYFIFFNATSIFTYLTFVHVPNHYLYNWKFLKKEKILSFIVILFTTLLSFHFGNEYFEIYKDTLSFDIIKAIIISHILYEELYINNY